MDYIRKRSLNTLVLLTLGVCVFTMLDNSVPNSSIFKLIALFLDVAVIFWALFNIGGNYLCKSLNGKIIFSTIVIVLCFLFSPYSPRYSMLLKFFGYFTLFLYGKLCASKGYEFSCNRIVLLSCILLPLLVVLFLDDSPQKTKFFANSNMFTFWGISMSLLYYLIKSKKNNVMVYCWLILVGHIVAGTSLGIIVAVMISICILNWNRINKLASLLIIVLMVLCIMYLDIPAFARMRDSIAIFNSLTIDDFIHTENVNFYEIQSAHSGSGRDDNASFLWRIMQWTTLLTGYIVSPLNYLFGMGADWSIAYTQKPPHNDFVLILVEYGIIVFSFILSFVKKVYQVIKVDNVVYFILPIIIYHITENLLDTFPPNIFFYLSIGYFYTKLNNHRCI